MHVDTIRGQTVAQIVARFPASARVFQSHRIDFCCHGEMTVEDALRDRPEQSGEVYAELEAALRAPVTAADGPVDDLSLVSLVGRIIDRHHAYTRRALPIVAPLAEKVAAVHGDKDPGLRELHRVVGELRARIEPHLEEEESVLFPLLMSRARGADVEAELARMRAEHLEVGAALERIRALTHDFATPEWACRSYRMLMAELEDLESDLLRHVHLENHVLTSKALSKR